MEIPLVTVIICNYNYGRYLPDAIESALSQTYNNIELIVVDDGSIDNSLEIIKRYKNKIKSVIKKNGGQASAFNLGVSKATGDLICFLDSDDFWYPNKVQKVVQKFIEFPYSLVCHDLDLFDKAGTMLIGESHRKKNKIEHEKGDVLKYIRENGLKWVFAPTTGISVTKAAAEKIFPLPEKDWIICADNPIAYGAACLGKVGVINDSLGGYRLHGLNNYAFANVKNVNGKIDNLIFLAKRYIYLKEFSEKNNLDKFDKNPKNSYRYYRNCVFISRENPNEYLPILWKKNVECHWLLSNEKALRKIFLIYKFLILDFLKLLFIMLRFPTEINHVRNFYKNKSGSLPLKIREYLEQDDLL